MSSCFVGLWIFFASVMTPILLAQHVPDTAKGSIFNTKRGILEGNNIRTLFYNHGEFGSWPDSPTFEWPANSEHGYVYGIAFIVQARAIDRFGTIIHPLETMYRGFVRRDPMSGVPYGWGPLAGYANSAQTQPAISSRQRTWPAHWPNKPNDWDGQWNGYFGRGVRPGLSETYFVMDDDPDKMYLNRFHPDTGDTTRGGLGIEVSVRTLQWSAPEARDMLFVNCEIVNEGTTSYDSVYVGWYMDPSIGGIDDSYDDIGRFLPSLNMLFLRDSDGIGLPGNWSPVGVVGYVMLATPENHGLTGGRTFPVHYYELVDDEQNWGIMKSRIFSSWRGGDFNLGAFVSSGPFTLLPLENEVLLGAFIFADDSVQLIQKASFARLFYESGFSDTLLTSTRQPAATPEGFTLYKNSPNPFNPNTMIRYVIPTKTHVSLVVYDLLGQEITTLVSIEQAPGMHETEFDGAGLSSGIYFYRIVAGEFVETRKLLLLR